MTTRRVINALRAGVFLLAGLAGGELQAGPDTDWQALIDATRAESTQRTVSRVNRNVNALRKISDRRNWQRQDYWATPWELLARGGGDCEDLAIAKYYLLRAHGIPRSQLRLLFTRAFNARAGRIEPHLVLLYQPDANSEPRVLDNMRSDVVKLSYRRDLIPTAAFDHKDYWVYRNNTWRLARPAASVSAWRDLRERWRDQQLAGSVLALSAHR